MFLALLWLLVSLFWCLVAVVGCVALSLLLLLPHLPLHPPKIWLKGTPVSLEAASHSHSAAPTGSTPHRLLVPPHLFLLGTWKVG